MMDTEIRFDDNELDLDIANSLEGDLDGFDDFDDFDDFNSMPDSNSFDELDGADFGDISDDDSFDDFDFDSLPDNKDMIDFDDIDDVMEDANNSDFDDFDFDSLPDNKDMVNFDDTDDTMEDDSNSDIDDFGSISDNKDMIEYNTEDMSLEDDLNGYSEGALIDDVDLHEDEDDTLHNVESDFITDSGNIVVQDCTDDKENGFQLVYVDIDKIAITQRIRKPQSVEALVQSIKSTGLLKPLVVAETATEGLYVLLDGYRRIQACARVGKTKIPCIVNTRVSTPEIPILEALYNHAKTYSLKEQIEYIEYLETQKGIMNPAMIEYLLQMNSGDYTKLKDILNDNDEDIITKLMEGVYDIATAFKKLEQRRRKESAEEKEDKKAAKVYNDTAESGASQIEGSGEEADGSALTEEQIKELTVNATDLDNDIEETTLTEMIEEDKNLEGFEPHKQKVGEREYVDPIIKKSVMARDNNTCQCCKRGGEQYIDILDYHHILPCFLGGEDTVDNGMMLCVACHRLVHLYSTDDLHIDKALLESNYSDLEDIQKSRYENEEIFEDEKKRFKRIIKLGSAIRKGIVAKGLNREKYKKEHSNDGIGRRKPGVKAEQEKM